MRSAGSWSWALHGCRRRRWGSLCALVSILFCKVLHTAPKLTPKFPQSPASGLLSMERWCWPLPLLVGSQDYNGAGMGVIPSDAAGDSSRRRF